MSFPKLISPLPDIVLQYCWAPKNGQAGISPIFKNGVSWIFEDTNGNRNIHSNVHPDVLLCININARLPSNENETVVFAKNKNGLG